MSERENDIVKVFIEETDFERFYTRRAWEAIVADLENEGRRGLIEHISKPTTRFLLRTAQRAGRLRVEPFKPISNERNTYT